MLLYTPLHLCSSLLKWCWYLMYVLGHNFRLTLYFNLAVPWKYLNFNFHIYSQVTRVMVTAPMCGAGDDHHSPHIPYVVGPNIRFAGTVSYFIILVLHFSPQLAMWNESMIKNSRYICMPSNPVAGETWVLWVFCLKSRAEGNDVQQRPL